MKIMVTGVAGLLGSRLVDWIVDNKPEVEVIGVDDLSGGYIENVNDKIKFIEMNLLSDSVEDIFRKEKPDIVYHFAAYAAEGLSPFIRKYNYENNLLASVNLINNSIEHNVKRFVFASSMSVMATSMRHLLVRICPKHQLTRMR